jgi:hypothetical protein
MLELKAFGGLRLEVDGAPYGGIAARPKTLGLLALLAPGPNGMSRDKRAAGISSSRLATTSAGS